MQAKSLRWLVSRPEFRPQSLQRRCFVSSSFKQRRLVKACISALRNLGIATWSFCDCQFSFDEGTWSGMSLQTALGLEEVQQAAKADRAFLETLTPADFLVLLLPAGYSSGWETGFAAGRGARIIVVGQNSNPDIPLLHADAFFGTWQDAVSYISEDIEPCSNSTQ